MIQRLVHCLLIVDLYLPLMNNVLSLHYLPNVLWMSYFLTYDCTIDVHEHYIKQSYRNRCVILSANGPLALTIPVKKTAPKMPVHQLEADPTVSWQRQHWESIKAAYGSSPYFIHYAPYFEPLFIKEVTSLMTFEIDLLKLITKLLKVEVVHKLSEHFIETKDEMDLRKVISPKVKPAAEFSPYLQVFNEKFGFVPNLSIIDLLFNYGPRAKEYLLQL